MANLFFSGEKASKEEARKGLMEYIAEIWEDRFTVIFHSDDGGWHIQAVLEVYDPDESLDPELREKFDAKWMGHRMVVLKVPTGHVDLFYKNK